MTSHYDKDYGYNPDADLKQYRQTFVVLMVYALKHGSKAC